MVDTTQIPPLNAILLSHAVVVHHRSRHARWAAVYFTRWVIQSVVGERDCVAQFVLRYKLPVSCWRRWRSPIVQLDVGELPSACGWIGAKPGIRVIEEGLAQPSIGVILGLEVDLI